MGMSNITSAAGTGATVGQQFAATAQSTASSEANLAALTAQSQETNRMTLATAQLSREQAQTEALGKFIKSAGDAIKGLAP